MRRSIAFVYGLIAYLAFFITILYAIGFVGNLVVPKSIDSGPAGPTGASILVNVALLALFAVQHSIMARPWFKERWTKIVPRPVERSTFVLVTSALLMFIFWQWRPMPEPIWDIGQPVVRAVLIGISYLGWAMVFYSSFLIDHFDLFGLRQVWLHLRGRPYTHHPFAERSLYRLMRHPLMTGFLLAFWFAPSMSQGHLLFAAVTTAYILVAVRIEEHDLLRFLGEDYRQYRRRTPMLLPLPKAGAGADDADGPSNA
ncbi:MAG: methanethiol S-methyltransferase [Planctomycetota bacterium]|jgi:protein-S-isoprenylcysteine O-methyltransferase Ste14